jgi:hypothetical protein
MPGSSGNANRAGTRLGRLELGYYPTGLNAGLSVIAAGFDNKQPVDEIHTSHRARRNVGTDGELSTLAQRLTSVTSGCRAPRRWS